MWNPKKHQREACGNDWPSIKTLLFLSFCQIIYSPGGPAEALMQGTYVQELIGETGPEEDRVISRRMLTNKQVILEAWVLWQD